MKEEKRFQGIAISQGFAIAPVRKIVLSPFQADGERGASPEAEADRFSRAFSSVVKRLRQLEEENRARLGRDKAAIFGAHALMLSDPMFEGGIQALIQAGKSAPDAIYEKTTEIRELFASLPDPYLRERAADVEDVGRRLFREVKGEAGIDFNQEDSGVPGRFILVTEELSPSEAAGLSPERVAGLITHLGGATSHFAIIVSALEIPAVSGMDSKLFDEGVQAVCDGHRGVVMVNPIPATIAHYEKKLSLFLKEKENLATFVSREAKTQDGQKMELWGNIASPEEAPRVLKSGATGVGLFRTEYLFMNKTQPPSEDEQCAAYKAALKDMNGLPTVIRTLDAGGDKQVPYLAERVGKEANPFLGLRAIRLCLREKELFMTQLRALLRAGNSGDLRIMIPMISDLSQVRAAKEWLKEAERELKSEKISVGAYKLGIMIEIPSAALLAEKLAREVDFFSVGTNDLIQYTLAVDRLNSKVSDLYQPWHPAVVRLLKQISDGAKAGGASLAVCGEMAGDPLALPLFVGLGFDELSMSPSKLLWVKSRLSRISVPWAQAVAEEALACDLPSEVRQLLERKAEELG